MSDRSDLNAELKRLNAAVQSALDARKKWMDAHMADYAKLKIGDEIVDMTTGRPLGVITEHYRYGAGKDPRYDDSMSIEYRFTTPGGSTDNTSRQPSLHIGTREDYARYMEAKAKTARYLAGLRE